MVRTTRCCGVHYVEPIEGAR
jgi:hypothetical protein